MPDMVNPPKLLIFCHGVGASGADLVPLATHWAVTLPDTAMESPDAPFPFDGGGRGRQWFSIAGITPDNRAARVSDAAPAFDRLIDDLLAQHGVSESETVLVGFSQGAIMSLDAFVRGRRPRAIIGYSGRLVRPPVERITAETDILLVHGTADAVIPSAELARAEAALSAAGASIRTATLDGVGHTISSVGAALGLDFLRGLATPRPKSGSEAPSARPA